MVCLRCANIPPSHLQTRDDGVGGGDSGDDVSRRALRLVQALHWDLTAQKINKRKGTRPSVL